MLMFLLLSNIFILNFVGINSHGLLLVPAARSSAWRQDPLKFPSYYNGNFLEKIKYNKILFN